MTQKEKFEDYEGFIEKFKPKKTTDDCMTPPTVYNVVRDWACREYGIDPEKIVRPFWPGGDYEHYDYPADAVVVDNPPFSILSKICAFYLGKGIPFFLFAPSLTCFSSRAIVMQMNHIICDADITYENGAVVKTSFVTSYGGDIVAQTAPELTRLINIESARQRSKLVKQLPKYTYPDHVVSSAIMQRYARYGVDFKIRRGECVPIGCLDAQRLEKKSIFGCGLLLSDRLAAEHAAVKKAAAEKAGVLCWELSERELEIIRTLSSQND